jgi:hypothetical protein
MTLDKKYPPAAAPPALAPNATARELAAHLRLPAVKASLPAVVCYDALDEALITVCRAVLHRVMRRRFPAAEGEYWHCEHCDAVGDAPEDVAHTDRCPVHVARALLTYTDE